MLPWRLKKLTQNPWHQETKKNWKKCHESNAKNQNNYRFYAGNCLLAIVLHNQWKNFG